MITYFKTTVTALLKKTKAKQPTKKTEIKQPWMTFYDPGRSINELRKGYPAFFFSKPGEGWYNQEDFANLKEKPCMRTILAELLEGSLNKTWKEQQKLIPEDCEIPLARQVMIMCLLHFLKTGEYLLKDVYVRCRDLSSDGSLLRFGNCDSGGACFGDCSPGYSDDNLGVVPSWKPRALKS